MDQISPEERREAVEEMYALMALDGVEFDNEARADFDKFVSGECTLDELIAKYKPILEQARSEVRSAFKLHKPRRH